MALTQAIHSRQTRSQVHLILIIPDNQEYAHMSELHAKANKAGIDVTVASKSILEFIRQVAFHRSQRQKWDMSPDAE